MPKRRHQKAPSTFHPEADSGHVLLPPSFRSQVGRSLDALNGRYDEVVVSGTAVLSQAGYDAATVEFTSLTEVTEYRLMPLVLEGLKILAGAAMANTLDMADSQIRLSPTLKSNARPLFKRALREFLSGALTYAAGTYLSNHPQDPTSVAAKEALDYYLKVTLANITFKDKADNDEQGTNAPGPGGESGERPAVEPVDGLPADPDSGVDPPEEGAGG